MPRRLSAGDGSRAALRRPCRRGAVPPARTLPDPSRDDLDRVPKSVPEAEIRPPTMTVNGDEQDQVVQLRDHAAPHLSGPAGYSYRGASGAGSPGPCPLGERRTGASY